jgi:outer membrane protein TolC
MKYKLFTTLLISSTLYAQQIDLNTIISHVRLHHPNYKALEEESLALGAKVKAAYARPMSNLSLGGDRVETDDGDKAGEYSLGLSTLLDLANTRGLSMQSGDLENEATLLERQRALFAFGNQLRDLYHQSCLDKAELEILESTRDAFEKLYRKKAKAYKYQEISKKELLQLKLEKALLEQKVVSQKRSYAISKEALLNLTAMPHVGGSELVCRDLYPIQASYTIDSVPFILSNLAFEKRIESLNKKYARNSTWLEPVEVSAFYDDEIDAKRVGAGVQIPLGFTSDKKEQSRIAILHQKAQLRFAYQGEILEKSAQKKRLEAELERDYGKIKALETNIATYKKSLMPLVEKSFQMGESSVIEYLMGRQKLLEISSDLISTKKRYYHTLFTLYTLIETEK